MKKILIKINNNTLIFKCRQKLSGEHKSLINTNVISSNELAFSDDYINENVKIVAAFIEELCKNYQIDTAIIETNAIYSTIINIFINNPYITNLFLKDDTSLTYAICEKIIKTSIKSISCYNLQPFMLELLDKNNIIVESRNEILFLSNFMVKNNLSLFSSLYYKNCLKMEFPMNEQDEEDFYTFCKINRYLKTINVNMASLRDLEYIITTLKATRKRNVKILIHDNITDLKIIEFLKSFNKKKSKHYKIYFKLAYSEDYIKKNIVKQTNNKILKTCGLLILSIIIMTFTYVFYDNYSSMQNVNDIKENISKVIEITNTENIIKEIEEKENISNNNNAQNNNSSNTYKVINKDLAALYNTNPDTVGWLLVNNTNIDYPVVQSVNNEYYLKHNFNMKEDNNGWVFMDYRNDAKELQDNTIFYAHNRYYSGVMFGTLQNALRHSWYTNEDNQIIKFRTLYKDYEFKIFSIYKIYKTNDYMSTLFTTDEVRKNFYEMLKERSIYDFGITPTGSDKIITLSTCLEGDNRIVVHAVLIKN